MAVGDFRFSLLLLSLTVAVAASPSDDRRKALSEAGPNRGKKEDPSPPRGIFAPRMYYDEWTPLGHGDPLKNDPNYDHVPPVLDHVDYLKEPNQRSPPTDPPFTGPSVNARRDPPGLIDDAKVVPAPHPSNLFQNMPDVPPTMLVPPPLPPRIETSNNQLQPTRAAPTTVVDVEPVNMILHSSTTISWLDFKNPVATMPTGNAGAPWKASNTPIPIVEPSPLPTITHTSTSPFLRYRDEVKERPFSPNSIFHKNPDPPVSNNLGHKPHFPVKNNPPLPSVVKPTIPIQQGQPFRLPQANPPPAIPNNSDDTESYASILQSLLDDTPTTTTEQSIRVISTTPPPVATTTASPMTTDHIFSHYKQPPVPVTAPLYLIIQGHSKVKTYGASKSPIMEIPHNEVLKDNKSKNRYSRDASSNSELDRDTSESYSEGKTLPKTSVIESDSSG